MSRPIEHRMSDLANAIDALLQTGQRDLARLLGCSHSTPGARGPNPGAWPLGDLLKMADHHPTVADALRAVFEAPAAAPSDISPERAARALIGSMGGEIQALAERLGNDALDDAELRDTETDLAQLAVDISRARAVIRARRRRA